MRLRRALLALLALYALVFVALSNDIMVRVWDWRMRFESPLDAAVLLYFEGVRAATTTAGIAVALWAAARVRAHPHLRELPFAILLATIAYTKLVAYRGFPGEQQEHLARWLQEARVPRFMLELVFAQPVWTAWLALAASVLLLAGYPRQLVAADVVQSGEADRRGALRDVAVAGADVGDLSRRAAAAFLSSGWTRPASLYSAAAALGFAHALLARAADGLVLVAVQAVALIAAAIGVAAVVSLFRASHAIATPDERGVLMWLRRGVLAGGMLFAVSGVAAILLRGAVIPVAALSLAPAAALVGVAVAVARIRAAPSPLARDNPIGNEG